jgi:glycosyltransferase involved in cell wall biosynthesis
MRILYLAQRVPYPPDRGDKIITYHQVRHLTRHHDVAVACLADGKADLANVPPLAEWTTSVDVVMLRPRAARLRALAALASGLPVTLAYFNEQELHARVAARLKAARFDALLVYSSSMAQFVEPYRNVPRSMHFADLDSLKWEQYAKRSRFLRSWLYQREYRRLLEYERHVAATFDHSLVCTPRELRDFQRLMPPVPASCVSNGVDLEYFRPPAVHSQAPLEGPRSQALPGNALLPGCAWQRSDKRVHELIFTGVMDYLPNVEGVTWFCETVLPLIRSEVPEVSLTICGSRPNAQVQALGKIPGVAVTGWVPDVRPYLERASVCIVPLTIARGIQNKVLEAMAMELPTVTCSAAAAGIEAIPGRDLFVADAASDFAAVTVRLLRDEGLRRQTGAAARACVEANYRWEHHLARLDRILSGVTTSARNGKPKLETED